MKTDGTNLLLLTIPAFCQKAEKSPISWSL